MRRSFLLFLVFLLLSACGSQTPTPPSESTDSVTTTATTTAPDKTPLNWRDTLMLSVSEGGLPTDRDAIFTRFAAYRDIGLTAVRIDTAWDTSVEGVWTMSQTTADYLEAARTYGLTLKLILPTIMAPPAWLSDQDGAQLIDQNGRSSVNTVSYWFDGLTAYCDQAIRAQLKAITDGGWADVVAAVIVDCGPAGEPLYPPAWTQVANGLDQGGGEDVMWCYAPNAQADFRAKMTEKYGDIASANAAWGTDYADFASIEVPKPNTVSGALWEDTLTWYYAVKREFMAEQVATFAAAMSDCGLGDRARILYLPGADFTDAQWANCVEKGSAIAQLRIGCDNRYAVELAAQTDCILQYTGINDVHSLRILREWMYANGYGAVPVLGENAGDAASASNVAGLAATVAEMHLCGFDYTHSRWLFESDGITPNDRFILFAETIASLRTHLQALDHTVSPDFAVDSAVAAPSGKVLRLDITFDKPETEALAFCFVTFAQPMLVIENGDTLEYDVRLSTDMAGLGAIDGSFVGGKTVRDSFGITDALGIRAHPNADLSDYAYPNWFHRVIELGNSASAGARLLELQLAAHPEAADGAFSQCAVTVWYDNIVIKRNGEVIAELFTDGENWMDRSAGNTHYASASATCEDPEP